MDPSIGVAGIYCSYRHPQTTVNLLGSLLRQLCDTLDDMPLLVSKIPLALKNVVKALSEFTSPYKEIFLIIDALDECVNRLDLLKALDMLLEDGLSKLLIIIATITFLQSAV